MIGHCCFCCSWFLHVDMKLSQSIIEKTILSPLSYHDTFVKTNWPYVCTRFWTLHFCPCVLMLTLRCTGYRKFVQVLFVWLFQNCFDYSKSLIILYILKNQLVTLYKKLAKILIRIVLKHIEGLHIKICYFNHSVFQTMNTVYFSTYLGLLKFLSSMFRSFCA